MAKKKARKRTQKSTWKSRMAAFGIAIAVWGIIWWLFFLRDQGISEDQLENDRILQARALINEIEIAIRHYRDDRGSLPPCPNPDKGAEVLFQSLLADEPRYLGPRPDRIRKKGEGISIIIDPWGHPIRYRTGAPPGQAVTPEPDYDLWITGGDPENPREKWIMR